jgi:hypothetical protein
MPPRKHKISLLSVVLCVAGGGCILVVATGIHAAIRFKDSTVARTNSYRISEAMDAYREHYKTFPEGSAEETIEALRGLNSDRKVFLDLRSLMDQQLNDPWGEPYCLLRSEGGAKPIFYSKGPDRTDDGYAPDSDDLGAEQPKQEAQQAGTSNGG